MNTEGNNAFFRESFRGFNKDDVAEYIAKLSKDYTSNEEKFREHIAKLTAELKAKTEETAPSPYDGADFGSDADEKIGKLINDAHAKDFQIEQLKSQLAQLQAAQTDLEKLREEKEQSANRQQSETESAAVNQLSFQLAESESEKLFLFALLKKFLFALGVRSASGKNIGDIASISDIAPKAQIADEIDAGFRVLAAFRDKAEELEAKNAELEEMLENNKAVISDEQKMYESVTAGLGNIIYSAKKTAEEISEKASAEAAQVINGAKLEAEAIIDGAIIKRTAIIEKNRKNMAQLKEIYGFIKTEHEEMLRKYKDNSEIYALRLSEIENTVNVIYDSVNAEEFNAQ